MRAIAPKEGPFAQLASLVARGIVIAELAAIMLGFAQLGLFSQPEVVVSQQIDGR